MKNEKGWGFAAGVCLLFLQLLSSPTYAQALSEVYVSPSGNILGAIFISNPGFSSDIYLNNVGLLVWVEMEIPHALIEVYSDGYIRLIEADPSVNISYADGLIKKIGGVDFEYEGGRVRRIGGLPFEYDSGQLRRMGDLSFHHDENGRIHTIGNVHLDYSSGRIRKIGDLGFRYDEKGLIQNIDGVRFDYEYGSLRRVIGNIPGVAITVTWVVEFRKKLPKY